MRLSLGLPLIVLLLDSLTLGQTAVPTSISDPQALALAKQAGLALTSGSVIIKDSVWNASATWLAGATNASGTATLRAKEPNQARVDINTGSSVRSEIRDDSNGPAGEIINERGERHSTPVHNCWTPAIWFSPWAVVNSMTQFGNVVHYLGTGVENGVVLDHLQMQRSLARQKPSMIMIIRKLSTVDVFLDANSHLPVKLLYSTHPEDNYSRNIPVEVRYTDYQAVNGVQAPFRIQKFINGSLNLDLQITGVDVNSGIPDTAFSQQ